MKGLFIRWLILTLAVILASYLIPGIRVTGFFSALFTAAILGILNALFRPILLILTLPINVLTLGLFTFVINALMLMMASGVVSGFKIESFWSALFGSLVISAVNWISNRFINDQGRVGQQDYLEMTKKDDGTWE
ncbi:MAG: phage holin family protein [Deltaproteobacteria bacterium]|nr:phage holin family protein [Deltaproteobacteria bacterium]